jgi:predicted dehydrogenase
MKNSNIKYQKSVLHTFAVYFLILNFSLGALAEGPRLAGTQEKVFRIGMIGLDTSHVIAFTKQINDPAKNYGCKVVAGYPGGSPDIPDSANRVEGFTKQLREQFGVEIVGSIEELCSKVDGVMLESVDGRPHLAQARPVIAVKKPLFIDKPMAGNLSDVLEIFRAAYENNVPCWSSSSLRFSPGVIGARNNEKIGSVLGCDVFSPCSLEKHHPDLYWYGVHGVEMLFTIMGTGCETVSRVQTKDTEFVVGVWKDGRIGTYRGLRAGKRDYGALIYGTKGIEPSGGYGGYGPLVEEIVKFFKTGNVPVPAEETIEIFAFMSAADESKAQSGAAVSIASVIEKAKKHNEFRRSAESGVRK